MVIDPVVDVWTECCVGPMSKHLTARMAAKREDIAAACRRAVSVAEFLAGTGSVEAAGACAQWGPRGAACAWSARVVCSPRLRGRGRPQPGAK
eukprot:10729055-Alexandrium_andersonii.AAC.1